MTAVSSAPANTPNTGLLNIVRISVNSGTSASGFTASLIVSIPNIKIANPSKISPISFFLSLPDIYIIIPISARTGEKEDGFNMLIRKLELSIPVRLKSHEVIVVPMFAPMMIPIACDSFMMPEFTKPTTMTVVAEDDWITAVTPAPSNTALNGFEVRLSKIRSNFPPDIFSRPPPITLIPYRNIARPPIIVRIPKIFIISPLHRHIPGYYLHFDSIL